MQFAEAYSHHNGRDQWAQTLTAPYHQAMGIFIRKDDNIGGGIFERPIRQPRQIIRDKKEIDRLVFLYTERRITRREMMEWIGNGTCS
jgi:hypothetical protein